MQITLNLATRPYIDFRPQIKRLRIACVVLTTTSIALGSLLHIAHLRATSAYARVHSLDRAIAEASADLHNYENVIHRPDNAMVADQVYSLNQLFELKAFSWTIVIQDLETVLPAEVQLTKIDPIRAKDGSTSLRLHVLGPRNRVVELIQHLEHSGRFGLPRIIGESPEEEGGATEKLPPFNASSLESFDLLTGYTSIDAGVSRVDTHTGSFQTDVANLPSRCESCEATPHRTSARHEDSQPVTQALSGGRK